MSNEPQPPALTPEREAEILKVLDYCRREKLQLFGRAISELKNELDRLRLALSQREGATNPRCGHPMSAMKFPEAEAPDGSMQAYGEPECSLCAELGDLRERAFDAGAKWFDNKYPDIFSSGPRNQTREQAIAAVPLRKEGGKWPN